MTKSRPLPYGVTTAASGRECEKVKSPGRIEEVLERAPGLTGLRGKWSEIQMTAKERRICSAFIWITVDQSTVAD